MAEGGEPSLNEQLERSHLTENINENNNSGENEEYMEMRPNPPHILERMKQQSSVLYYTQVAQDQLCERNLMMGADPDIRDALEGRAVNRVIAGQPQIQKHLRGLKIRMLEIGRCSLVRTRADAARAYDTILEYKNLVKELEEEPVDLCKELEDAENLQYETKEEQMFLQRLCFNSINTAKDAISDFEEIREKIENSRRTRSVDFMLDNDLPLPMQHYDRRAVERSGIRGEPSKPRHRRVEELIQEHRGEHGLPKIVHDRDQYEPKLP